MTTEDRLRQALAAEAETVRPAPDAWGTIRQRIDTRRRRRLVAMPALATAAVMVAAVLGVTALSGDDGQQVATEPPATATPAPPETSETTATTAPLPETFLAVRDHATEIALVETATGEVRRTVVDLGDYPENGSEEERNFWPYVDGLTLTPDGRTAYYSVGPEPAVGVLYRVSLDGGEPAQIGNGAFPQVSPDGRFVAWQNGAVRTIEILDLVTGQGRVLEQSRGSDEYPGRLAWAPNSRHLAFESWVMGPGGAEDTAIRIRVVDAIDARRMDDSRVLAVEEGRSLHLVGFRAFDGLLGVVESAPGADGGELLAVRDPDGGAERGTFDLPFTATAAGYDRSGRHQLLVADDGTVHRRSGGPVTAVPGLADVALVAW